MSSRANSSRERILATAEEMVLKNGFASTTIDEIIDKAAITKGGFFYHFNGKTALARALIDRYVDLDTQVFHELSARADSLSEDPLQRALIFLMLFAEMVAGMTSTHPGCLAALFTYESKQFDDSIRQRIEEGMLNWRTSIRERLVEIVEKYPPRLEVSVDALADMFTSCVEGGIILARVYDDNQALVDQVMGYRTHLRLLFADA